MSCQASTTSTVHRAIILHLILVRLSVLYDQLIPHIIFGQRSLHLLPAMNCIVDHQDAPWKAFWEPPVPLSQSCRLLPAFHIVVLALSLDVEGVSQLAFLGKYNGFCDNSLLDSDSHSSTTEITPTPTSHQAGIINRSLPTSTVSSNLSGCNSKEADSHRFSRRSDVDNHRSAVCRTI